MKNIQGTTDIPYSTPPENTVIHASSKVDLLDYKMKSYPLPRPYGSNKNDLFTSDGSQKSLIIYDDQKNIIFNETSTWRSVDLVGGARDPFSSILFSRYHSSKCIFYFFSLRDKI
jgi:hypothetical protein